MIALTHVSKDFGKGQQEVHAVRDVSLSIDKGEIFGIIGFSGAGKSTLVRCINLLERPIRDCPPDARFLLDFCQFSCSNYTTDWLLWIGI